MALTNCQIVGLLLFPAATLFLAPTVFAQNGQSTSRDFNPFNTFGGTQGFGGQRDFSGNPFSTNTLPPPGVRDRERDRERERDRDTLRDPFNPFSPQRGIGLNTFGGGPFGTTRLDFDNTYNFQSPENKICPPGWEQYEVSCYRFVRSPIHNRDDARRNCQAYGNGADLLSINSLEEHTWIVRRLTAIDPQHREWYVSGRLASGSWINADGTQFPPNFDQAFLQDQPSSSSNLLYNHIVYSFSERRNRAWGLLKVTGYDLLLYICEVPLAQVPYIDLSIDDRDFDYGIEVDDVRKIPKGPYFIQEPEDVVFDLSRNILRSYVSLSCLADGWPAPTYEWYKEEYLNNTMIEIHIDPLKNPKYTISGGMLIIDSPKQIEDRGNYHCVATNKFGSVISQTASISFGYIGEFIPTRAQEIGTQYWGKAIFCDPPQHYPSVLYYWSRKSFPNLVEEDQRVFVSYDGNLYISSVDMSDYGLYTCHVQSTVSGSGRTGPLFRLHVTSNANYQQLKFPNNFPKAFPEAPKAGNEVRLECVAFGYPVPAYNWTRKIGSIPKGAILSNYNRVLTIPNVKVEDQGEYVCRATNNRLSIEDSVTLSIQAAPNFTIPLGNRHMDKDDDLVWICEAFGIPDVEYQWYRNGKLLAMDSLPPEDAGRYQIQDNVLTIRELNEENDAGMYQCRANNSLFATFSTGQLRVLYMKPSFKKNPVLSETLAAEGGNVTIRCQPEAAPRPTFVWKKDGNIIGSGGRRRAFPDGTLVIQPVSRDDQGLFTCVAQNVLGVEESSGWLEVLQGPILVEPPPEYDNYTMGSTLNLNCRAEADPALDIAYVWRRNGFRLDDEEYIYRVLVDPRTGFLEISNVTIDDRGEYECEVNTWVGSLRAISMVHVMGPPGPSGGVQAYDLSSTTAIIRWSDGATNGAPQFLYTIEGRTQWDPVWRKLLENVEADRFVDVRIGETTRKEKLVGVLSPWSAYEFRILAANRYGYGIPSPPSPQYNTLPDRPFIAPRNVGGGGGKTGSLTIAWDPLPAKDQNAPGIYYKVFWRETRNYTEGEYQSVILKQWGNIGIHVVPVPSINFYTLYDVKVQAWNDLGSGPESAPVQIFSAEDMPQAAPALVTPRPYNSTAINVTWIPVEQTREKIRGKLIGYRIRYWLKEGLNLYDPEALNYLSRSTEPWALIVGLQPNTYYYMQVMAYNSAGPGPASEAQYDRTMKKAPQMPPISVAISMVDATTIRVTWRFVSTGVDEEALIGYKVRIWPADQDIVTAKDHYVNFAHRRLEAIIGGLQPAKKYLVRVLAYSQGGDGKMSSPAQEIILGDPLALRSSGFRTLPALLGSLLTVLVLTLKFLN